MKNQMSSVKDLRLDFPSSTPYTLLSFSFLFYPHFPVPSQLSLVGIFAPKQCKATTTHQTCLWISRLHLSKVGFFFVFEEFLMEKTPARFLQALTV